MKVYELIPIYFLYFFGLGPFFVKSLDKKTQYKENQHLNPKLHNLFFFIGPIMYIFIKRIKEFRKIEYFEQRLKILNKFPDSITEDADEERRNIQIYLKLKKIKNRI